jgi:hypothetical protein
MPLPSHGLGRCHDCRQPIRWSITAASHRQALNPDEDPRGNVAAYLDGTGTWRSRVPTTERPIETYEKQFMPHAATCTRAPRTLSPNQLPAGVASLAAHRRKRNR